MLGYLSRGEMLAVIGTPDGTWIGQRDHVLFLLLYNTGARVSEITGVKVGEAVLDDGAACVHLHGKSRKQRSVPLWRSTVKAIRVWLKLNPTRIGGGDRNRDQPRLGKATDLATYDPSHHGNASVAGRRRYQRDRALARA